MVHSLIVNQTNHYSMNAFGLKQILKEILRGLYSDPPGEILYQFELNSQGAILRDRDVIPLLNCYCGKNALEGQNGYMNRMGPWQ